MQQLAERQRGFAAALLDPALPMPDGLVGPDREPGLKRFAVYRNNVVVGLTETLKDAFPAVHRIVGADFFRAMARAYVMVEPPRSPIMLDYGAGFADFIRQFEPAAVLPYLADVARMERAWTEAYHAPEASPIDPGVFMAIAPDQLPSVRLALHPSLRILRSKFPALTIWQMNVADGVPAPSISPPAASTYSSSAPWPMLKSGRFRAAVWNSSRRWPTENRCSPRWRRR